MPFYNLFYFHQKLYSLVSEWNGIVLYNWYSFCPCCVRKSKRKPFIFRNMTQPCPDSIVCYRCHEVVNSIQIQPPLGELRFSLVLQITFHAVFMNMNIQKHLLFCNILRKHGNQKHWILKCIVKCMVLQYEYIWSSFER